MQDSVYVLARKQEGEKLAPSISGPVLRPVKRVGTPPTYEEVV